MTSQELQLFNSVPVLEQYKGSLSAVAVDGNRLFLATSDGRLASFTVEVAADTKVEETLIRSIRVPCTLTHIFYLHPLDMLLGRATDGTLSLYKAASLNVYRALRLPHKVDNVHVQRYAADGDNTKVLCRAKKQLYLLLDVCEDHETILWKGLLPAGIDKVCIADSRYIYYSLPNASYKALDTRLDATSELLVPRDEHSVLCPLTRDHQDMLLLNTRGRLGCFLDRSGNACNYSPIAWAVSPSSSSPVCVLGNRYVLAVCVDGNVYVHDIELGRQVHVQSIRVGQGKGEVRLYEDVCGQGSVYVVGGDGVLRRVVGRVREEVCRDILERVWVDYLHVYGCEGMEREIALVLQSHLGYKESVSYLLGGDVDPREFIQMVPRICTTFSKSHREELHTSIRAGRKRLMGVLSFSGGLQSTGHCKTLQKYVEQSDEQLYTLALDSLKAYLVLWRNVKRNRDKPQEIKEAVDTALFLIVSGMGADHAHEKQYSRNLSELYTLLYPSNYVSVEFSESVLLSAHRYVELGLLYDSCGQYLDSIRVFDNIYRGVWEDDVEECKRCMVKVLVEMRMGGDEQQQVFWRGVHILADRGDCESVYEVCVARQGELDYLKVKDVLESVSGGSTEYILGYLEHLVYSVGTTNVLLYNELIELYLSSSSRSRLYRLLSHSPHSGHNHINTLVSLEYWQELVLVYSSLGKHDQVLSIMIDQLHDHRRAWRYCSSAGTCLDDQSASSSSEQSVEQKSKCIQLFKQLLGIYAGNSAHLGQCMEMIREYSMFMGGKDIIESIPSSMSLSELLPSLERLFPALFHRRHSVHLTKCLARCNNLNTLVELEGCRRRMFVIDESSQCRVCRMCIGDKIFKGFPNGDCVHFSCVDRYLRGVDR